MVNLSIVAPRGSFCWLHYILCVHHAEKNGTGQRTTYDIPVVERALILRSSRERKVRQWTSKEPAIVAFNAQIPSAKTASLKQFSLHARYVHENLSVVLKFYSSTAQRFKRLAFKTYIARQRAYDRLIRNMVGGHSNKTLVMHHFHLLPGGALNTYDYATFEGCVEGLGNRCSGWIRMSSGRLSSSCVPQAPCDKCFLFWALFLEVFVHCVGCILRLFTSK